MHEPERTALVLALGGALLIAAALLARASGRAGVPLTLGFLAVGVLAGTDGPLGIEFEDYALAFRIGSLALALILFDGGLNTPLRALKEVAGPASLLATVGVVLTAAFVAVGVHFVGGLPPMQSMLIGAVVSSTDAAAVFSVLRGSGLALRRRLGLTLELESGLNDPAAVILTMELTSALVSGQRPGLTFAIGIVVQLAIGAVCGVAFGFGGAALVRRVRLPATGLYPVLTLGLACTVFGAATLLHGSGFLAVYLAGMMLGREPLLARAGLLKVHDAVAWCCQVGMFLLLGLLVAPSRVADVAPLGIVTALLLAFVARPLAVAFCLAPFSYPFREVVYIGWVGLRGAVPIVLATFPVLAKAPGATALFDIVFVVVVMNALLPGSTIRWMTAQFGLEDKRPPPPAAVLEIASTRPLAGDVLGFHIHRASPVFGASVADLPFPEGAAVMLVVRGTELVAARGNTVFSDKDHVYVFCRPEDRAFVQLLFGASEGDTA